MERKSKKGLLKKRTATPSGAKLTSNSNSALAAKLSKALSALAKDLPNPADESTDYFHPFVAALPSSSELSPETIKQALKVGASYRIDWSSADGLFSNATDEDNWGDIALGFRLLEKVMQTSLSEISVAFARRKGLTRVHMWLFGRAEDSTLVSLHAMTTET